MATRTFVVVATPHGRCALDVSVVLGVRAVDAMDSFPVPRPGVVGVLDHEGEALPVLSVLGSTGRHVVLAEAPDPDGDHASDGADQRKAGFRFGLLVDQVVGVERFGDADIAPPPAGQDRAVIGGVHHAEDGLRLVLDVEVLSGRLLG